MRRRNDRAGERLLVGPPLIVVSFPSAIPRRVAPQQSPLPLRRLAAIPSVTCRRNPASANLSPISLSQPRGAVQQPGPERGPLGRWTINPPGGAVSSSSTRRRAGLSRYPTSCTKGGRKPAVGWCMPGAGLSHSPAGKAPPEMPAFQPYWGKPAVRNERGDRGDVGIIRSPVRASIPPADLRCCSSRRRSFWCARCRCWPRRASSVSPTIGYGASLRTMFIVPWPRSTCGRCMRSASTKPPPSAAINTSPCSMLKRVAEPEGVVAHLGQHPALVGCVHGAVIVVDDPGDPNA